MAVWASRTADLASVSCARERWPRNAGRAIAARMPMIRMTTSSSIRVKPFSSWARERSLLSMWVNPPKGIVGPVGTARQPLVPLPRRPDGLVAARLTHPELRGFASRPRGRFAFSTLVLAGDVSARLRKALTPAQRFLAERYPRVMLGRRLLVLMAVLLGLTALAAALAPRPTVAPQRGGATATPTPAPSATADGTAASRVVTRTVKADAGARPTRVRARAGDTIRLSVSGDVLDAVELKGLDEIEPVEPGSPARFRSEE